MSDLIDRKTVFDVIDKCILEKLEDDTVEIKEPLKLITKIYRIPSAQLQRKTGKWMSVSDETQTWYHCSECHYQQYEKTKFCTSCGAEMDGENDD